MLRDGRLRFGTFEHRVVTAGLSDQCFSVALSSEPRPRYERFRAGGYLKTSMEIFGGPIGRCLDGLVETVGYGDFTHRSRAFLSRSLPNRVGFSMAFHLMLATAGFTGQLDEVFLTRACRIRQIFIHRSVTSAFLRSGRALTSL